MPAKDRPEIEFVYFDLGNVLLFFDHQRACRQMAELSGASHDVIWSRVFQGELQIAYETGDVDCEAFDRLFRETCGPCSEYSLADLKRATSDIFVPNEAGFAAAQKVAEAGVRRGILSNTCPAHWEFVLEQDYGPRLAAFDVHALSYELRSMKPAEAIYRRAAELAGAPLERILFLDDRPENVDAALRAGYHAHVYDPTFDFDATWASYRHVPANGEVCGN
ncbi:MAG TPA: HAD family phosphatase [Pirellulaceae bacterium]|jgi:putative hydrolase of the HAD superfamily|nr:HAD family phosphatase [Pirellulaceae bacterium]